MKDLLLEIGHELERGNIPNAHILISKLWNSCKGEETKLEMRDKIYFVLNTQMKPLPGYIVGIRETRDERFLYDIDIDCDPGEPYRENGSLQGLRLTVPAMALVRSEIYMHDKDDNLIWPME